MSPGLFLSLYSGKQAGQGRLGTWDGKFLFPFAFFRCHFPQTSALASTSAPVMKSSRSGTVNPEAHRIRSQGHSVRSCNFNREEEHFEAHGNELQVVVHFYNSKISSLASWKSLCRHFLSSFRISWVRGPSNGFYYGIFSPRHHYVSSIPSPSPV